MAEIDKRPIRGNSLPGVVCFLLLMSAHSAFAGMPAILLSDIAAMRVRTISFFLVVFLLVSKCVQLLWNNLHRDFAGLPLLSYSRSVAFVTLVGLAFNLVLTMISGARELMTPGAWEKDGLTYKLGSGGDESRRVAAMEELRFHLWQYSATNDGDLPPGIETDSIRDEVWIPPGHPTFRYVYVPGHQADHGTSPIVYEPGAFGKRRVVLLADGQIVTLPIVEIEERLAEAR